MIQTSNFGNIHFGCFFIKHTFEALPELESKIVSLRMNFYFLLLEPVLTNLNALSNYSMNCIIETFVPDLDALSFSSISEQHARQEQRQKRIARHTANIWTNSNKTWSILFWAQSGPDVQDILMKLVVSLIVLTFLKFPTIPINLY